MTPPEGLTLPLEKLIERWRIAAAEHQAKSDDLLLDGAAVTDRQLARSAAHVEAAGKLNACANELAAYLVSCVNAQQPLERPRVNQTTVLAMAVLALQPWINVAREKRGPGSHCVVPSELLTGLASALDGAKAEIATDDDLLEFIANVNSVSDAAGCRDPIADRIVARLMAGVNAQQEQEHQKDLETRVDEPSSAIPPTGSTAASNEAAPTFTEDEYTRRAVAVIRDLYELKEDVLYAKDWRQPEFDAGFLDAAVHVLLAAVDSEDARVVAELDRWLNARLSRVMGLPRADDAVDPVNRDSSARPRATDTPDLSPPVITPGPREGQDIEPVDVVGLFTLGGPVTTATTREVLIAAVLDRLAASPISEVAITSQGTKPYDPLQDTHPGCSQHPSDVRTMCCLGCVAKEISTARRRAATAEKENKQLKSVLVGLVERANTVLTNPDPPSSQEV